MLIRIIMMLSCLLFYDNAQAYHSVDTRGPSYPYISGDSFRFFCDFVYDELDRSLLPEAIQEGNTIFVKTDYLHEFFYKIHPYINNPYILITHNSDYPAPWNFASFLEDKKIIAWFGQNVENCHPKLHAIPIGFANSCWGHGHIDTINQFKNDSFTFHKKNIFLYMNFNIGTCPGERGYVASLFQHKPYCHVSSNLSVSAYLQQLNNSKFTLSPRGNGLDAHRTWEALLMGSIPIVKTSTIDSLFDELPVVIVKSWEEVNEDFLNQKWEEMSKKTYRLEKLYFNYWADLINSYRTKCKSS